MHREGSIRAAKRLRRDVRESASREAVQGHNIIQLPNHTSTAFGNEETRPVSVSNSEQAQARPVDVDTLQTESREAGPRSFPRTASSQQHFKRRLLRQSEFRVFVLNPGSFADRLTGRLTEQDLAAPPEYYALSYAWGQEHAIHTALIDNCEVSIRPNLFQALRRIRSKSLDLYVWIDDVCINQNDKAEKSSQVERMADIFQKAVGTFVWLGEGTDTSTLANECIHSLVGPEYDWTSQWWKRHDIFALIQLLNRSWFSRGWVVQEVAFSKTATIYCGDWQLPLDTLKQAVDQIQLRLMTVERALLSAEDNQLLASFHGSSGVKLLAIVRRVFEKSEDDITIVRRCLPLEHLVEETRFAETTDRRDAIFAFMSLANDISAAWPCRIVADYSKSDLDVYAVFIEHCIQQSLSLDIICRPWAPPQQIDRAVATLPSWIATKDRLPSGNPSSQHTLRLHGDPFVGSVQRRLYNCSFDRRPKVKFERQLNAGKLDSILYAKGIVLGQIAVVSTRMINGLVYRDALEILGTIKRSPSTLWSIPDAIWRTLCADRGTNGDRAPFSYRSAMLDVLRFISETSLDTDSKGSMEAVPSMDVEDLLEETELVHTHAFLERVRDSVWNRRAFRSKPDLTEEHTNKSMVGLVPRAAKTGDVICILYGCSVPVVLRKSRSSTSDESWVLIGDAYVNGVMNGEEINDRLRSGSLKQIEREIKIK